LLIVFEDAHLLVINKPAGMNTHAPSPYAGEGIYDWLRHREPRWADLSIIHRLDKETSGIMVFGKTTLANRSLTDQFASRSVKKRYLLATDRTVAKKTIKARSTLVRTGEKYLSRPLHAGDDLAETEFSFLRRENGRSIVEARPSTGRTHQIRVHAAEHGFPILGDQLYGGISADRLWLHAAELEFTHPVSGEPVRFQSPVNFTADSRQQLRQLLIDPAATNAYRLVHGASDGWPGWYVDRLSELLLSQSDSPLTVRQREFLGVLLRATQSHSAYHKTLARQVRRSTPAQASPKLVVGEPAASSFEVRENGVRYELSFDEGYSTGIFLDQRDNRRRLLQNYIGIDFPVFEGELHGHNTLNVFAYTCAFSICAALAGARTTSLDLSKKYLDWGARNFALNGVDPAGHDFIYGDAFDWMRRFAKKNRVFEVIILDPPTFSQSKVSGIFRAAQDYARLIDLTLPLLAANGVLLASTNAAQWPAEDFVLAIESAVARNKRDILAKHYFPQPPDFPVTRAERAYLKTVWLRIR
jgi:23S rRNA (cytosine1962-C5)-methyltransferase